MKITRRYFDQSQREYEEIERELELEKQGKLLKSWRMKNEW